MKSLPRSGRDKLSQTLAVWAVLIAFGLMACSSPPPTATPSENRSIIAALQTQNFARLRVGIGRQSQIESQVSYVLDRFSEEEAPMISDAVARVVEATDCLLEEDIDRAMSRYN